MQDALQAAKARLKQVETRASGSGLAKAEDYDAIRAVTGLHTDEDRLAYFLNGGVDAWITELQSNLAARGSRLEDVTFATRLVALRRQEKLALHALFRRHFAQEESVEASCGGSGSLPRLQAKVETVRAELASEAAWLELQQRLDDAIGGTVGGAAFIKLTTRSPKDSYAAILAARRALSGLKLATPDLAQDHGGLWTLFSEQLRLAQRVTLGAEALLLLATSRRVFEDLSSELFEQPAAEDQGLAVAVRDFDDRVTPVSEFRGFVWNRRLTCCGQYFFQLHFPEALGEVRARIEADLRRFFTETLQPNIPQYMEATPCFMLDFVWLPGDDGGSQVMLTEINPFDGEALGVFPASTGLFCWDKDRALMTGQEPFQLRMREEPLITAENLTSHPQLRNLSPIWKSAIYS